MSIKMKALRMCIIIIMAAVMLVVWPIHPIREVGSTRSGDEGHVVSEPLEVGMSAVQKFKATDNNVIALDFVMTYDDSLPVDGELLFEFMDEEGTVLQSQRISCGQIPDYAYCTVILNLRLQRGKMYQYRLSNLSVAENKLCLVYTSDRKMYGLTKGALTVGGKSVEGEALTRIESNRPLNAESTLAIWGGIGLVGFTLCELTFIPERRRGSGEQRQETGES